MGAALSDDCGRVAPGVTRVIPFFAFPPEIRRVIYTTNALESVHCAASQDHQDTRAIFPNDERPRN
jgi:transposase-like protein